jgi:hypothetical protein
VGLSVNGLSFLCTWHERVDAIHVAKSCSCVSFHFYFFVPLTIRLRSLSTHFRKPFQIIETFLLWVWIACALLPGYWLHQSWFQGLLYAGNDTLYESTGLYGKVNLLHTLHGVFSFLVNYTYVRCNSLLINFIISVICTQSSSSYWKGTSSNIWFLIYCQMFSQSFSMAFHFELKLLNIYACVRRELIIWS